VPGEGLTRLLERPQSVSANLAETIPGVCEMIDAVKMSTDVVQPKARLRFWREAVCDTFVELECHAAQTDEFFGTLTNSSLLDIQFSLVRAAAQRVVRTRSKIAQSSLDYYLLSLQTHGQGVVAQDGRTAILNPGDFALYDTTRPYDLTFTNGFGQLVLRLPREIVSSRLSDAETLTALPIQGDRGAGRLASAFIHQLHAQLDQLDPQSARRLHASAVDLLATALASQMGIQQSGVRESQILIRQRIRAFIDRQLSNPDLSCQSIAAHHGISARYLRKLFEGSNESVSAWIWKRRLDQARRDLVDPLLSHIAITSIGYEVGFKNAAHFSRAFKARFGVTPREFRAGNLYPQSRG
jgi:AraC-like DNA-binding protein